MKNLIRIRLPLLYNNYQSLHKETRLKEFLRLCRVQLVKVNPEPSTKVLHIAKLQLWPINLNPTINQFTSIYLASQRDVVSQVLAEPHTTTSSQLTVQLQHQAPL